LPVVTSVPRPLFRFARGHPASIRIRFRGRDVDLEENEMLVVPKGVEHMPVAEEEAHVLLVEPNANTAPASSSERFA